MIVREPVAVFFADLNLSVDEWQSAATWAELQHGKRDDVVPGAPVVVTDEEDAFAATVTEITPVGPHLVVHWDRPVEVPGRTAHAALA